jgi:hypothetical protein
LFAKRRHNESLLSTMPYYLRPAQFSLRSLFVFTTIAGILLGIVCLPIPIFMKLPLLLAVWLCLRLWETRIPSRTSSVRLALIDGLGIVTVLSSYFWARYIGRGTLEFSSFDLVMAVLLLLIFSGHLIPRTIVALCGHSRSDR